ncbi:putative barnase/colicin E5 family endoribonuclease [Campylobacter coli]|uniref:putative barnase/colicin E5 family endoribonuclease n=1 Tax=Campylobacter coli TaxID=195 RepID=UPI003750A2F7
MTIQIPQGAKTMQLFDMNIDIPEGKTYIDIDDNFLQNKYNQFMQNNQQQNNFNSQEELALDGKPMSMYQAPQVSQNEPQEQGVWSKINKGLEDFNNLIDPKRMISEGFDYLSPRVTSGEEGARQKIEDATNQVSGGLLPRIFTSPSNEEQKQIFQIAYDEIKKLGYEPFLEINNGDYKYIGVDKNGKEVDFTPSFRNTLASTKNELAFSVAGGYAGSLAKTAGQTIGKKALNYFAPSAIGAGSGAVSDLHSQSNNTGIEASYMDYAKRFGSAAAEDALAGAVVGSAIKGIGKTYKSVGDLISSAKTGARAGKDMIDGMAVKGGNLGNRVIDKITQKDIPMIGKFTDGGLQNAETIFNNLTKNVENKKQIDELIAKENPTYLENGKPTIEILKNIVEQGLNKNNPQFIQDSAKRTSAILKNISNALQGVPTTQRREILLKSAQAYPEIGSFLDDVLKADKDASISFLNIIKEQDEVFKNKTGLNGEFDYKAWQKDNSSYKKRINNEYAQAIKSIDELNNGSIRLSKEDLAKIEEFKNNNFLEQDIKTNISSFLEDAIDKDLSAEQIFNLRSAINKQLATGNKTYNTKEAYRLVKDTLDETMIKNASDKELAKKILEDANKNYALKENFNNSYLGKIKDQETPEALAQRIANGARNINEDKDLKRAFEGMNEVERKANEKHAFNALLAKHRIEDIGYDFKNLAKDMDNVEFVSKDLKYAKEVVNVYAKIYQNNKDLIMTALASSGKKTNSSIATTIQGVFDRILISGILARLHALVPFVKSAKEQALRNQILDALKLAKTNKEVISNLKNIKIADKEQSRIFKDALDNYIKVDKEQNKILKDALIKEGVIKGDNFFMDKADPSKAKSDYTAKFNVEKWINNVSGILKDEWVVNLKAMAKKHPEMFKNEADVFKVIKEIKDNPTHFFKNYDDEVALIAKPLKDDKVGNIAIKKDSGKIIYINKTKGKDLERLNRRNKAMLTGTPTPATTKGSTTNVEGDLLQHSFKNSTQTKPKKNLMDDIKENIKAKEVEKKNKKSVKQKLDEKIQNDKKASEDILKRYDNFLKENKDYNLDFLDNMNLNTVEYNLTRQMIINAKESTNKGVKKDIPSALRGKIEQELNIQPLKEFGENYAEYYHDGKGALQKLLIEKQGQVAGAFHRKDLGDIDLVWGEVTDKIKHKGYGLAHIIDKHPELDLKLISDIVDKGKLNNQNNIRYRIEYKNYIIGLSSEYKGNKRTFIITAFERYKG